LIWFIDNYPKSIDLLEEDRELVWKVSE